MHANRRESKEIVGHHKAELRWQIFYSRVCSMESIWESYENQHCSLFDLPDNDRTVLGADPGIAGTGRHSLYRRIRPSLESQGCGCGRPCPGARLRLL